MRTSAHPSLGMNEDSMATTHQTVITRDGRVISIQRDELNQADYTGMVPPVSTAT